MIKILPKRSKLKGIFFKEFILLYLSPVDIIDRTIISLTTIALV
jgi:hypothetical protein